MNNLKEEQSKYNSVPVLYCKHCLSLKILSVPKMEDSDYCDECGSTDIELSSIEEWEKLYVLRYGHKYIDKY